MKKMKITKNKIKEIHVELKQNQSLRRVVVIDTLDGDIWVDTYATDYGECKVYYSDTIYSVAIYNTNCNIENLNDFTEFCICELKKYAGITLVIA